MKLARINSGILALILVINGYIIVAPLIPAISFWWDNRGGNRQQQLTTEIHRKTKPQTAPTQVAVQPNHVIIPVMLLDQPVLEGPVKNTYSILAKGIWHWPNSSTPDKGGNTVLIGHRFTYTQPKGVFYYLNKLQPGDEIGLFWNNKQYTYKVTSSSEVPPNDTAIEDNTPDARLTLFTCTPLWLPKDRLVVVAALEDTSGGIQ